MLLKTFINQNKCNVGWGKKYPLRRNDYYVEIIADILLTLMMLENLADVLLMLKVMLAF